MWSNSEKNMSDEQSKNAVIKGLKIKLPTAVINEKGNPQATTIGKDTSVKKHCTCKKLSIFLLKFCIKRSIILVSIR